MKNLLFFLLLSVTAHTQQIKMFGAGTFASTTYTDIYKTFPGLFAKDYSLTIKGYNPFGGGLGDRECIQTSFCRQREGGAEGEKRIAVFHYGTNDGPSAQFQLWEDKYVQYIQESFLDIGYNKNFLVITTIPWHPDMEKTEDKKQNAINYKVLTNPAIRRVAARLGIALLDLEKIMQEASNPDPLYADLYHLSEAGHKYVYDYFRRCLPVNSSLPIKTGSLKVKRLSKDEFEIEFVASETTETKEFVVYVSDDGKQYFPVKTITAIPLISERKYNVTFKIDL